MKRNYLRLILAAALLVFLTGMGGHRKPTKFTLATSFYTRSEVVEIIDLRQPAILHNL
jgi:hypothetical protein